MYRNKDHDPISALDIYVAKQSITNPKYLILITNYDDYNRGLNRGTINSHITKFTRGQTMKQTMNEYDMVVTRYK